MLTITGLYTGYGSGDVLRGVDLTVQQGSVTCVVGPNGAGKSTLLKIVSGLLRPRLGSVTFRGTEIGGATPRKIIESGIVQVMQSRNLFPELTVRENVELGGFLLRDARLVRERMAAVAEQFPVVAERAGERAGQLSGGQQRMVEFARALMLDPVLILLDEPSMGLSPLVLKSVFDAARQMNASGATVLLVEQNARAGLKLSHHGVVMENGTVRLAGTGREVLEHPEIGELYLGGAVRNS